MEDKKREREDNPLDIIIQKGLIETAEKLNYVIPNQETLDYLLYAVNQCFPQIYETVLTTYDEQTRILSKHRPKT